MEESIMRQDPTEFRERFKRWKAGEKVYDAGTPTMPELQKYNEWVSNLPKNLQNSPNYDLYGAWKSGATPELQDDGFYHLPTRDPNTGLILKGDFHPTLLEGLAFDIDAGYHPKRENGRYYTRSWQDFKTVPEYDGGKTPEDNYTYYAGSLPTVTIEGHKPTLWENIGNWFVDATKRAAFNENPSVMTASGWTPYPDGSTRQDTFNTPERNKLADKLVDIGEMGAWNILPEAILTPALEYGLKGAYKYYLTSPFYKKKVLFAINDAVGPWDKTKDAARAIIDDQLVALKKQKIHFVDNTDPGNSNVLGRHFFDTNDNYVSIKDIPFRERIHSVWHELSHGTERANPLIEQLNGRIYLDNITKYPALGDFAEIRARANSSLIPKYLAHRIKNNKKIPFRKYISDWIDKTTDRNLDQKSLFDAYTESELYDIYGKAL